MKRGDQPVNVLLSVYWKKHPEICGLTVRELAAIAALTGILSNPSIDGSAAQCAKDAVTCADNLLAELEEGDEDEEADQDEVVAP